MEPLLSHCAAAFSLHGGLFTVFFLGGLTGGFTHCLAMCGPIVASEALSCHGNCLGACSRTMQFSRATGLMYHLGRASTYGAIGFFAAYLSKQVATFAFWPWLSSTMLFFAGSMFIVSSLQSCRHALFKPSGKLTYVRGVLMGFMPCGLLYAAVMMAATLANPWSGLLAMWIFTLGTLPALLLASCGAEIIGKKWRPLMITIGRAVMGFNGISLLVMASRIIWK